jgi:hypothetical protein
MDVRARCCPILDKILIKKCPARVDTLLFYFLNDYYNIELLNKNPNDYVNIITNFIIKIGIKNKTDIFNIIKLYEKENKNDNNDDDDDDDDDE